MKYCRKCGKALNDNVKFCTQCGAPTPPRVTADIPATVYPTPVTPEPVNPVPVNPAPVNPAPVDPVPVNPAPVNPAPVNPVPVDPMPIDPVPVYEAPKQKKSGGKGLLITLLVLAIMVILAAGVALFATGALDDLIPGKNSSSSVQMDDDDDEDDRDRDKEDRDENEPPVAATEAPVVEAAPEPAEPVTLNFIAAEYSNESTAWWQDFEADFEAANPTVDLIVDVVSWNDIYVVVDTRIANGEAPDILNIDAFADYQAKGLLLPVNDYMSNATYSKFYPSLLNESKVNGKVWAVPDLAVARALYYNADLLAETGLDVPSTWAELLEVCEALYTYTGILPLGMDMTDMDGAYTFAHFIWNNGGDFADSNGNWNLNSAANIEAMEFAKSLADAGLATYDRYTLQELFALGELAMVVAPYNFTTELEYYGMGSYGIAPIPTNTGTSVSAAAMDRFMCFDNNYSAAELAAITAFFDFFYEDERYADWITTEGFLPVTSTAAKYMSKSNPMYNLWGNIVATARLFPSTKSGWFEVKDSVIEVMNAVLEGGNASDLMNTLQANFAGR